jgi:hypothetical protein
MEPWMSLYKVLDNLDCDELLHCFNDGMTYGESIEPDETELWLCEVAFKLAENCGERGYHALFSCKASDDSERLRAVACGLGNLSSEIASTFNQEVRNTLLGFLESKYPLVQADAIASLTQLGYREYFDRVFSLIRNESPYVFGQSLHFLAQFYPETAKPLILEKLRTGGDSISLQWAIDEADDLDYVEAVPLIKLYERAPDPDLRQAAMTAIVRLVVR